MNVNEKEERLLTFTGNLHVFGPTFVLYGSRSAKANPNTYRVSTEYAKNTEKWELIKNLESMIWTLVAFSDEKNPHAYSVLSWGEQSPPILICHYCKINSVRYGQ